MEINRSQMSRWSKHVLLFAILLLGSLSTFAQETNKGKKIEGADAVREEIQRYMGYEPLMPRYLSLPYDATTNSNVNGPFVDIGFLFMALIPVIFLFGFRKKPMYGIVCMVLLLGILYVSIGSGKVFINNQYVNTVDYKNQVRSDSYNLLASNIIDPIYAWVSSSYQGVNQFFSSRSGNSDGFTYPILFTFFVLMIFLIRQRTLGHKNHRRILILFISFFTFMWMLLTAGIIWYGYPMIAISLLLIFSSIEPKTEDKSLPKKIIQGIGLLAVTAFIILSLNFRLSNYTLNVNPEFAKNLFDEGELKYQSGRQNKKQVLNGFFPGGINEALAQINRDKDALVYRVGTVLPFFVAKNDRRVYMDNQLQNFERLRVHYKDKNTLIEVLNIAGYKYIFVDLQTYSVDKTPERTLEKKYKEFMRVLYDNPKVKLLATNRRINTSKDPQKPKPDYGVFGAPLPNFHGTYAIFEILD